MLDHLLQAQVSDLIVQTIRAGRGLAQALAAVEIRDPDHDAILHRIADLLRARRPFHELDASDLDKLANHLEQELGRETDGATLCAGYTVTTGDEEIHGDLHMRPRHTARGVCICDAQKYLDEFMEVRNLTLDVAAAYGELTP